MQSKIFLFYMVDTATGICYYLDNNGNLQTASIYSGFDVSIQSPDGWLNTELSFKRNTTYYGTNRSFSLPLKFVLGAARIIRQLYYTGKGVNIPLTLIVLKYNELPKSGEPLYKLYYRGQLDLKQIKDLVAEGVECNLMEGGVVQLLKTYENTIFEIPCDGSIPENVKVNLDGLFLPDTFHYQIGFNQNVISEQVIPCFFQSNDGDNFGIVHNDPQPENFALNVASSPNYIFQSIGAITVHVKGNIIVRPYNSAHGDYPFHLYLIGSNYPVSLKKTITADFDIRQQQVIYFDATYDLAAGEKLYFAYSHNNKFNPMAILGGNFDISFNSKEQPTAPWCISALDLFKLLIREICGAASSTNQIFNYDAVSTLLESNLNLLISSGDAIRASGDANYQKYFSATQLNSNQPSNNVTIGYGPSIKTSLADFFKSMSAILCGSLGNQQSAGQKEAIFFEKLKYVFNPDTTPIVLGEVSNFKVSVASDMLFNEIEVGYEPQSYDQKAGKYEFNTKANWVSPLKTLQKKFQIVSKYRTDSYGIERLRANIGGTSPTRNDSDNSVFIINANRSIRSLDSETASFDSATKDPYNGNHTNIDFAPNHNANGIRMSNLVGSYLAMNNDPSIFVFTQSTTQPFSFSFSGSLNGAPANSVTGQAADTITVSLFVKGVKVYSQVFTSVGASTPFSGIFNIASQAWAPGDCIYAIVATSLTGSTSNMQASYSCGVAGAYWTANGSSIGILGGVPAQLIAMPNVTPAPNPAVLPVVSYGFPYFFFNSILVNSTFDITASITAVLQPGAANSATFKLYYNGLPVSTKSLNNDLLLTNSQNANLSSRQTFSLGDVVFLLADVQNIWAQVQNAQITFTSTTIQKFGLKRVQYSSVSGIPSILNDTTSAGAPYNIEDLTPKRILKKWSSYIRSILFNQMPGKLSFLSLSKNQYLSTAIGSEIIIENSDYDIRDMDTPLLYPLVFEFDTKVPINFSDLLTTIPNTHIQFPYNGMIFYGFPLELKQKPSLNESQQWKLICSPKTNIQNLVNLNIDGLNTINMPPNSIYCPFLSGVQFVPQAQILDPKYHTRNINMFWFSEQISGWINQNNYYNPWQIGETIPIQIQTNGLSPVIAYLYSASTKQPVSTVNLTQKSSNALAPGSMLWEGNISLVGLPVDTYYIYVNGGGSAGAYVISEGLDVRADWPDTLLFEYKNSTNKQAMVFDTGFSAKMRVKGFLDNRFKPKFKGAFYVDQPQNITVLNAIPFENNELWVGMDDGVPDYVIKKLLRIMLLDTVTIDGIQYSLDEGAEWEEVFIEGNPKKYWKVNIRPVMNIDGIAVTATGISADASMVATADANAFGPNANNATNLATADIISIKLN